MNKGAVISPCGQYRYQLWRIWNEDKPLIMFICLNPSTATAYHDDPTLRRLIGFAYQWQYGGLYLGNLFAYRSTSPAVLDEVKDPIGPDNDRHIKVMSEKCTRIVFAWGNQGFILNRENIISSMFPVADCLGKTKAGSPNHPLYLSKQTELIPFK